MRFCARRGHSRRSTTTQEVQMTTDTATHITQVGTIIVPVSDQDAAIAFYTEKLGFEKRSDTPFGNGDRWVEVGPAGHTTTLALMPPREGEEVGISTRVA